MGERGHRVLLLAREVERLAARDDQAEVGAGRKWAGESCGRVEEVLEVVEEQEEVLVGDVLGEAVVGSDGPSCFLEHEGGVAQRCERHPEDAVGVVVAGCGRGLQGEPGLAGAAGAGEGEQANVVAGEEREHLGELVLAAEERGCGDRQVGAVEALQRRELVARRAGRSAPAPTGPSTGAHRGRAARRCRRVLRWRWRRAPGRRGRWRRSGRRGGRPRRRSPPR